MPKVYVIAMGGERTMERAALGKEQQQQQRGGRPEPYAPSNEKNGNVYSVIMV